MGEAVVFQSSLPEKKVLLGGRGTTFLETLDLWSRTCLFGEVLSFLFLPEEGTSSDLRTALLKISSVPMSFSLLSWNVENFTGESPESIAEHVYEAEPDAFGLYEIKVDPMMLIRAFNEIGASDEDFENYEFALTQGKEQREILAGIRRGGFEQTIFTQKRRFKVDDPDLRPGALLTVSKGGELYNVLFLHLDSGVSSGDFGNRAEMMSHVWNLKHALDKKSDSDTARLIVMGDLNTMGILNTMGQDLAPWEVSEHEAWRLATGSDEVDALRREANKRGMRLPPKQFDATYCYYREDKPDDTSNLDHVLATKPVNLRTLGTQDGEDFAVRVRGWNQLEGAARKSFTENTSDHSSLYCEVVTG